MELRVDVVVSTSRFQYERTFFWDSTCVPAAGDGVQFSSDEPGMSSARVSFASTRVTHRVWRPSSDAVTLLLEPFGLDPFAAEADADYADGFLAAVGGPGWNVRRKGG